MLKLGEKLGNGKIMSGCYQGGSLTHHVIIQNVYSVILI